MPLLKALISAVEVADNFQLLLFLAASKSVCVSNPFFLLIFGCTSFV